MRTLIVLVICAVSLCTCQAQPTGSEDGTGDNTTQTANQAYKSLSISLPAAVNKTNDARPRDNPSQGVESNRSDDPPTWTDRLNAASTAVIALFTILLFFGVVVQIRTGRAIERAWIVVELKHEGMPLEGARRLRIGDAIEEVTSIPLTCTTLNGGKTPAWVIEKRIGFEIFENAAAIPKTPPLKRTRVFDDVPHTVYTKEDSVNTHMPVAQGRLNEHNIGVLYGAIHYRDIFDRKRTTTFGYRVFPEMDRLPFRLERLRHRPKYNMSK